MRFSLLGRRVCPVWPFGAHCFGLCLQLTDVDPLHFRPVRVFGVHSLAFFRCEVWAVLGLWFQLGPGAAQLLVPA